MTQTRNRFFDEASRLMNDAAGVAQGVRREFDTMFRSQAERVLGDLDVVRRDEFEAVKDMARLAREENAALKARVAALEARLDAPAGGAAPSTSPSAGIPPASDAPPRPRRDPMRDPMCGPRTGPAEPGARFAPFQILAFPCLPNRGRL